jgi:hypothetical protein
MVKLRNLWRRQTQGVYELLVYLVIPGGHVGNGVRANLIEQRRAEPGSLLQHPVLTKDDGDAGPTGALPDGQVPIPGDFTIVS